jgi:hypothetical protein
MAKVAIHVNKDRVYRKNFIYLHIISTLYLCNGYISALMT